MLIASADFWTRTVLMLSNAGSVKCPERQKDASLHSNIENKHLNLDFNLPWYLTATTSLHKLLFITETSLINVLQHRVAPCCKLCLVACAWLHPVRWCGCVCAFVFMLQWGVKLIWEPEPLNLLYKTGIRQEAYLKHQWRRMEKEGNKSRRGKI